MRWLTLDYIKEHSRLCENGEDGLLEMYGTSAEDTILNLCNRSYEELVDEYGGVPVPIRHASLELTEHFYSHRSPVESGSLATVPYNFDLLVKPYIKL